MSGHPVGTVRRNGGSYYVKLDNPRRWVTADVVNDEHGRYVVAWDCTPIPEKHQRFKVTEQWWLQGYKLRIITGVEIIPTPTRAERVGLPTGTGPTARADDPDTAKAAGAKAANPDRLANLQARVLAVHAEYAEEGLTDYQVGRCTGLVRTSTGRRRLELQRAGLIEQTASRRPTDTGATAIVYRITELGLTVARRLQERAA